RSANSIQESAPVQPGAPGSTGNPVLGEPGSASAMGLSAHENGAPNISPPPEKKGPGRPKQPVFKVGRGRKDWLTVFDSFVNAVTVQSKESGKINLGASLWSGQRRYLREMGM